MAVKIEGNYLGDWLRFESENGLSREVVTVKSGRELVMGEVIGRITKTIPTTGVAGTNTGTGTCTDVVGGAKTKVGTYKLVCIGAATNGGTFQVVDPDGATLPNATVGELYSNPQIGFKINNGGADFVVGDTFSITVTRGSGKVKAIDFAATDGSQEAAGVMIAGCDATTSDTKGLAVVRNAQIVADYLAWPTGATEDQKHEAMAQLYSKGIVAVQVA
ncbi:MAG: head decoration protein [Chloroflexota bacterium]